MPEPTVRRLFVPIACALAALFFAACAGGDEAIATPDDPAATPTAAATEPDPAPTEAPTATPIAAVPAAPSDVVISGALSDLDVPVPEGSGQQGRVSVSWAHEGGDLEGFRIYVDDCEGDPRVALDVPVEETTYGPLNPCRPARVGVAAFGADGESEIAWGVPEP